MGDPKGFLNIARKEGGYRPVELRVKDYDEVEVQLSDEERRQQSARCMDCGVPFCTWGCPLGNIMPEWQDMIYRGRFEEAWRMLQETNCFPEFTGRVCPALCEASCVLAASDEAVTIRQNEWYIIDKAWDLGLVKPEIPKVRTGKKVAVIGGGPSGLACADILNKRGHTVTLYEAEKRIGGFLRYGIPDFKLNKSVIDRRLTLMEQEGVIFKSGVRVGRDLTLDKIKEENDALCITIGARKGRDLPIPGRELSGIHFAFDFLSQQNRLCSGDMACGETRINAFDKRVVVIGGGDTGADCVGTANRQGAVSIHQLEVLPQPPEKRTDENPWPLWPRLHKVSSSHKEGCERLWCISTKEFIAGEKGEVKAIRCVKVEWTKDAKGNFVMNEIAGSEFVLEADVVLLAMGFVHPEHEGPVNDLSLEKDPRGNIKTNSDYMTSVKGVFAAGDAHRGASLVVWAIAEGREAAYAIDRYLKS